MGVLIGFEFCILSNERFDFLKKSPAARGSLVATRSIFFDGSPSEESIRGHLRDLKTQDSSSLRLNGQRHRKRFKLRVLNRLEIIKLYNHCGRSAPIGLVQLKIRMLCDEQKFSHDGRSAQSQQARDPPLRNARAEESADLFIHLSFVLAVARVDRRS